MTTKRDSYVDTIEKIRHKPEVLLFYEDGRVEPFTRPLHELGEVLTFKLRMRGKYETYNSVGHSSTPFVEFRPFVQFGNMPKPISIIQLFTLTSKMRCPSFSLPAGPTAIGGTCKAAGKLGLVEDDDLYICHGCYATTGNYGYNSTQLTQAIRRVVVEKLMRLGEFVNAISDAIVAFQSKERYATIKEKVDGKMKVTGRYPIDSDFIRLHDSGDVLWLNGYLRAWINIAQRNPQAMFWMPDRDWALGLGAVRKIARELERAPGNFVLRPSTLHVGDPAPVIEGLDAGTSVAFPPLDGIADFNCPAYDQKKEKTCQTAPAPHFSEFQEHCRVCWTDPEVTVNYEPHGARMKMDKLKSATLRRAALRQNPPVSLDLAYREYLRAPKRNPGVEEGFEAWLARRGLGGFAEEEWWELLEKLGLDAEETAAYLEATAEWQP
jgi:hypothetical protein